MRLARPSIGTAILVGFDRAPSLRPYFRQVRLAATIHNSAGVKNDEAGAPIFVCEGQRKPWPVIWPDFKSYG